MKMRNALSIRAAIFLPTLWQARKSQKKFTHKTSKTISLLKGLRVRLLFCLIWKYLTLRLKATKKKFGKIQIKLI